MNLKKNIDLLIRANKKTLKEIYRNRYLHVDSGVNYSNLYEEVHKNSSPCFVLSTGRCGTHLLTKLLLNHKQFEVYHEPVPSLVYYSKYAFENYEEKYEHLKIAVDAARYDFIRDSYLLNLQYIETNNRITFFANQLADLYPNAKFIHLIRNPLEFVKSGLNREWYSGKNSHDEGRIKKKGEEWDRFSDTEKIAWLWEKTNMFIEDFKQRTSDDRIKTILSEDLFNNSQQAASIFEFLNHEPIEINKIEKIIGKPTNTSQKKDKSYTSDEIKNAVAKLVTLDEKYGYNIS